MVILNDFQEGIDQLPEGHHFTGPAGGHVATQDVQQLFSYRTREHTIHIPRNQLTVVCGHFLVGTAGRVGIRSQTLSRRQWGI